MDKRITGLSQLGRELLAEYLREDSQEYQNLSIPDPIIPKEDMAAAYEALAELVESAGRENIEKVGRVNGMAAIYFGGGSPFTDE